MARVGLLAMLAMLAAAAGLVPSPGCAAPSDKSTDLTKPENKTLRCDDGFTNLHITYFRSPADKESPVVVLLHMKDGNRFVWQSEGGFAEVLQKAGYAVITVDLRFHGESKVGGAAGVANANQGTGKKNKGKKAAGLDLQPGDYKAMFAFDMEAVKDFIKEEHVKGNLNMNKMGIVGPEMGASVATYFAVLDWDKLPYEDAQPDFRTPKGQDVRALVLISPENKFHGLTMAATIPVLQDPEKNIAFLICCGSDLKDKAQSEKIFDMVLQRGVQTKKRMYFKEYNAKLTGIDLLGQRLLIEENMLGFFNEHLQKLDSPWRERRSKRELRELKKK